MCISDSYCIIDNPPDIGLNVVNALAITDEVIVPVKVDEDALEGLDIEMCIRDRTEIVPFVNELFHVFPSFLKDILLLGIRLKGSGNLFSL